ncbi:MAG TPA: DUF456 domain-containing protein [Candidatus Lustribacter sp.]|nr:DUF456 domain-containing protein [Candidatus Lustribacter sp.]
MGSTLAVAILMLVGVVGIVVPIVPGLAIVWLATALWAWVHPSPAAWVVFGTATFWYVAGLVTQYVVPGRRMKAAGVRTSTLLIALVGAVVGFFVIPVVGGIVGFVLGIYAVELARAGDRSAAWASTKHALRAVGLSMGIELGAALLIVTTWVIGVLALGT